MSTSAIVGALFAHAQDMAIGSPPLPVFFEGVAVKPPNKPKYLWVSIAPNETTRPTVAFDERYVYQGVVLINLFWPNGTGLPAILAAADEVRAHWQDGTRLDGDGVLVEINRPPSVRSAVQDAARMFVPIVIEYRATAQPLAA
jgi:hypothetical protein